MDSIFFKMIRLCKFIISFLSSNTKIFYKFETFLSFFESKFIEFFESIGLDRFTSSERAVRAIEFGIIGITGAILETALFLTSIKYLHYLISGFLSFYLAVSWNFLLNREITFKKSKGNIFNQYYKYISVCVFGFILYEISLKIFIGIFSLDPLFSNIMALLIGGIFNFIGSEMYAFPLK